MIRKFWEHLRKEFYDSLGIKPSTYSIAAIEKASAWYLAAYTSKANERLRIISFPWILEDVLQRLRVNNIDRFSYSLVRKYCQNREEQQLVSVFIDKIEQMNYYCETVDGEFVLIGLSGLFLFEEGNAGSQLVYNGTDTIHEVGRRLKNMFDQIDEEDGVLKCHDFQSESTLVIYKSTAAHRRLVYLRNAIFEYPLLLPYLYTISHFIHLDKLFVVFKSEKLKLEWFLELLVEYYLHKHELSPVDSVKVEKEFQDGIHFKLLINKWCRTQTKLNEYLSVQDKKAQNNVGRSVLEFYKEFAFGSKRFVFKSKFEDGKIEMSDKSSELVRSHFYRAFNLLLRTTEISHVWNSIGNLINISKFYNNKKRTC